MDIDEATTILPTELRLLVIASSSTAVPSVFAAT